MHGKRRTSHASKVGGSSVNAIVSAAQTQLIQCKNTGDVRKLSAKLFQDVQDKTKDNVFSLCGELLGRHMHCIAFDFAHRMKKQYDENTFDVFEMWLAKYVRGWGECDDFCVHAFGELICQRPALFSRVVAWTVREEFWMRRAASVVLLVCIRRNRYQDIQPLRIADILMQDRHHLVLKGYGWMLKELSLKEPELVFAYLLHNRAVMPRIAYRYALQKLGAGEQGIPLP